MVYIAFGAGCFFTEPLWGFMPLLPCCLLYPSPSPIRTGSDELKVGPPFVNVSPVQFDSRVPCNTVYGILLSARLVSWSPVSLVPCPRHALLQTERGRERERESLVYSRQRKTTAFRLPALQFARHFRLLIKVPPLNLNTSENWPIRGIVLIFNRPRYMYILNVT